MDIKFGHIYEVQIDQAPKSAEDAAGAFNALKEGGIVSQEEQGCPIIIGEDMYFATDKDKDTDVADFGNYAKENLKDLKKEVDEALSDDGRVVPYNFLASSSLIPKIGQDLHNRCVEAVREFIRDKQVQYMDQPDKYTRLIF